MRPGRWAHQLRGSARGSAVLCLGAVLLGVVLGVAAGTSGPSTGPASGQPAQAMSSSLPPGGSAPASCDAEVVAARHAASRTMVAFCVTPVHLASTRAIHRPDLFGIGRWSLTQEEARRLSGSVIAAGLLVGAALRLPVRRAASSQASSPAASSPAASSPAASSRLVDRGFLQQRQLLRQARCDQHLYLDFLEATR